MNVKKTIKKIAAIAIGTAMLGSTMLSASATLEQFPAPFVANGMANVQLVIGSGSTDDYLGALDIATSLQAASVTQVAVTGTGATASVEGGVSFGTSSDRLYLGRDLENAKAKFTDADFSTLLADETVSDEDGDDYDYEQKLVFSSDAAVVYDDADADLDDPTLRMDMTDTALWTYTATFTGGDLDVSALDDSETISLLGKSFTVDKDSTVNDLILYGADVTSYMELNTPKTITADGKSYTIEIVGANSDATDPTIILDVNGVRKTVSDSVSTTINGLDLYVKDLFVTNIPTLSASANIFVGSQKVEIQDDEVKINDEAISGLGATLTGATKLSSLEITYTPSDLNEDVAGFDETNYLLPGKSISDPLFGTFKVLFDGANYDVNDAAKSMVKIEGGSKDLKVTFTNNDDNKYTATLLKTNSDNDVETPFDLDRNAKGYDGILYNASGMDSQTLYKNQIFFVNELSGGETNTVFFEVTGFDKGENISAAATSDDTVTLKNLMTSVSKDYKLADDLADSDIVIGTVDATDSEFVLDLTDATVLDSIFVQGGYHSLNVSEVTDYDEYIYLNEAQEGIYSPATKVAADQIDIYVDLNTADDKFKVSIDGGMSDGNNDFDYLLTDYGTYAKAEAQDSKYVELYVPKNEDGEVSYNVFAAPTSATVTKTATGTTTDKVNPIAVGVAVRDADVNIANPSKNLIVIGGTCINSVSAKLKNVAANTCGEASGLKPGEATIELFTLDNGKVAMLVAGWEAVDTQAAARAVATKAPGLTGNKVTLSVTSANQYTIKQ